jgi:hypothetical protein
MAASLKRASSDRVSLSQAEPFWPSGNSINLRLSSANKPSNIFRSASVVAMVMHESHGRNSMPDPGMKLINIRFWVRAPK